MSNVKQKYLKDENGGGGEVFSPIVSSDSVYYHYSNGNQTLSDYTTYLVHRGDFGRFSSGFVRQVGTLGQYYKILSFDLSREWSGCTFKLDLLECESRWENILLNFGGRRNTVQRIEQWYFKYDNLLNPGLESTNSFPISCISLLYTYDNHLDLYVKLLYNVMTIKYCLSSCTLSNIPETLTSFGVTSPKTVVTTLPTALQTLTPTLKTYK